MVVRSGGKMRVQQHGVRRAGATCLLAGSSVLSLAVSAVAQQADSNQPMEEVTVTAARRDLLGTASTASEGVVDDQEIQLTPAYRPGQLLETVPGLVVTLHSGEGKANQYLLRGYNLDHGTDLETYVDGMPINQPTHAHGQGYTDLNFMIPELADEISYTKGPYYANVGDFGAVGSVRINYRDSIADQVSTTVGTLGFERLFTAQSQPLGQGHLLEAVELQHYDGPFVVPDDARKENAVLRYSEGGEDDGFSVTGMLYHQVWTNTTDIPLRAVSDVGYFGSLDPSDGGHALRGSLSANYHANLGTGQFSASTFYIYNQLNLFNDFTHFLVDPIHGDQEDQFETRNVIGSAASYTLPATVAGFQNELLMGALTRYDIMNVGRLPSEGQMALTPQQAAGDPASFSNNDNVNLFAGALYLQATTHWSSRVRSVLGLRDDYQHGTDDDLLAQLHETAGYTNGGARGQSLLQPKASLIYTPWDNLEFYVSAGEGFHSADLRGVNQDRNVDLGLPATPLLAQQWGEEIGLRTSFHKDFTLTFALYNLWQQSETIIDPDVGMDTAGPPSERYGVRNQHDICDPQLARVLWQRLGQPRALHPALRRRDGASRRIHHGCARRHRQSRPLSARPRPLERRPDLSLSGELSAVLRTLRQFRRGARLPGRGDILRQCPDGARSGQWQGIRTAQHRRPLCLPAGLGRLARHLQSAQHPRRGGRVLVRRPIAIRDLRLSGRPRRYPRTSPRAAHGQDHDLEAILM